MQQKTSSLPEPDSFSKAHSEKVRQYLHELISKTAEKRITFAEYMQQVLYAPNLGYYAIANRKFGKDGDFITAPEISALFGQCIALQIKQIFEQIEEPVILEFGAGSGKLALDIIQKLAAEKCLPSVYYILEVSAALQQRQQQFLREKAPELFHYFKWLNALPDKPINGVILANEVLDAMPCHRFHIDNNIIHECYVIQDGNNFKWSLAEPSSIELKNKILALNLQQRPDYTSEMNLIQPAWIQSVAACLNQGLMLLIDYGYPEAEYYHPQRKTGTLKCFFRQHQHEDPFMLPGIQDITAHVNFTAIARAAIEANLDVIDYTTQTSFLINCGIEQLLNQQQDRIDSINAIQQFKKLTLSTEMGELFKVIALSRKIESSLIGFRNFSRLHSL